MTAEPVEHGPLDPEDILRRLPRQERDRFIRDYRSALEAAHELWRYRQLQAVLRLWDLRASAYAQPDFAARAQAAQAGDPTDFVSAGSASPDGPLSEEGFQTMLRLIRRFADHEMDQFALWQFSSQVWGTVFVSVGLYPVGASAAAFTEVAIDGS